MKRVFSSDLEKAHCFAKFSSDKNSIHLDTNLADKYPIRVPIMHGALLVLQALSLYVERFMHDKWQKHEHLNLQVSFLQVVEIGEPYCIEIVSESKITISIAGSVICLIALQFKEESTKDFMSPDLKVSQSAPLTSPNNLVLDEFCENLDVNVSNIATLFGKGIIKGLLYSTSFLGSELPGEGCLILSIRLHSALQTDCDSLFYNVIIHNERHNLMRVQFESENISILSDVIKMNLFREECPDFVSQTTTELSGKRALVIGGSGDVGKAICYSLAKRSAIIQLTYLMNFERATTVKGEIEKNYRSAISIEHFDVRSDNLKALSDFDMIFYCASPRIIRRSLVSDLEFSRNEFHEIYVKSFERILREAVRIASNRKRKVFFINISSIAVEDETLTIEYRQAKKNEEAILFSVPKNSNIVIANWRLPRMTTRQTNSVILSAESLSPFLVLEEMFQNTTFTQDSELD